MARRSTPRRSAPDHPAPSPPPGTLAIIGIALAALTIIVFASVRHAGFIQLDDPVYVAQNPHVAAGLTPSSIAWAFTTFDNANWHPLTWLSHLLDVSLFGLDPGAHHLTNLVLHTVNVVLLFVVLHGLTAAPWRSAVVAALFAVHPAHVESVAWISERKDVLSTFFGIATLAAYVGYVRSSLTARGAPPPRARAAALPESLSSPGLSLTARGAPPPRARTRRVRLGAVVVAFALGLLAKPMLVTLPFVLLLLDLWPLGRLRGPAWLGATGTLPLRALVVEKLPLFALAIASSIVTVIAQQRGGAVMPLDVIPLGARVANAIVSYAAYLQKLVWPADLAVFYPYQPPTAGAVAAAALMLAAVTAIIVLYARRNAAPLIGWCWYLGTLVPVIGLVQVGRQAMADRYTYVPYIGLFIAIAFAIPRLAPRKTAARTALAAGALAAIVACAAVTRVQLAHWQSNRSIWTQALAVTLDLDRPQAARAVEVLTPDGRAGDALAALFRVPPPRARRDLGLLLAAAGRADDAAPLLRESIATMPDATTYEALGRALAATGDVPGATDALTEAVRQDPDLAAARSNLGRLLGQQGRFDAAQVHLSEAVRLRPQDARARCDLGLALAQLGRLDDALAQLEAAREIDPTLPEVHNNLGLVRAAESRLPEALRHFEEAVRLDQTYVDALRNLGVAHLKLEQPQAAIEAFERVLRLDPNDATARQGLALLKRD